MSLASLASSSVMRTMGVAIRGDHKALTRTLVQSAAEVDAWEKKTSASATRWATNWRIAGAGVVLGLAAVVLGLGGAALAAVQFEKNMRNVNSLLLESDARLSSLSRSVLEIARQVPQTAENLAEGLYDIASSGFEGAEGLMVLEASAVAASAGLTTTAVSAGVVTSVLNAYGLSAASSRDVTDILFSTVNYGVVTFEELAGSIGNVIGMASSAQVPIADVGAALATMTLSGVGAAEASTSLNRVIQSIIQPSEALAAVYKQLGYESGLQALQAKGLYGVMEDLRQVTQGNTEAYLRLFPEIRAARGAFALAANEGEVYAGIQDKIGDATKRAGATQTAFAEQMESTSAKWAIFTSSMRANTIEVGLQILPVFNGILDVLNPMANQVLPMLSSAWAAMAPYMAKARDIGLNLWEVLKALYDAAVPIAGALASIGGAVLGAGLDVLLTVLEALTGLMADNKAIVVTLAALYLARLLPSVTAVSAAMVHLGKTIQYNVIWNLSVLRKAYELTTVSQVNAVVWDNARTAGLNRMSAAMRVAAASSRTMAATTVAASTAASASIMVLVAAVAGLLYVANEAGKDEVNKINELAAGIDTQDFHRASEDIKVLEEQLVSMTNTRNQTFLNTGDNTLDFWFGGNSADKQIVALGDALEALNAQLFNTRKNATDLSEQTGLAFDEILKIAQSQDIDLTQVFDTKEAESSRDQFVLYVRDIEKQTGLSAVKMTRDWQLTVEEIEALGKALDEAGAKAAQAFAQATNVLGTWKPNIGIEEEAAAVQNLADARADLSQLESEAQVTSKQLASAREAVVKAEDRLLEAQAARAAGTLEAFYREAITTGENFTRNLDRAVQMGLDPQIVARLLQEGPNQAGPIVEQMVADNTGALIAMVNQAEASLQEINSRVVLQARLTAIAVNAKTEDIAKQLPQAMEISSRISAGESTEQIALAMGLSEEGVRKVAENYGLILINGISSTLQGPYTPEYAQMLGLTSTDGTSAGVQYGNGFVTGLMSALSGQNPASVASNVYYGSEYGAAAYAGGGILPGWTPGRDVHRFYSPTAGFLDLSGGEGIARPELVAAMGAGRWNMLNSAARTGGITAVQRMLATGHLGSFANGTSNLRIQTVAVPMTSTHKTEAPMFVDKMFVQDPGEGRRQARQKRALNQIGGRRNG